MVGKITHDDEGMNPQAYELWLQERCRMMLTECINEFFREFMGTGAEAFPNISDFVESFMKRHNLK